MNVSINRRDWFAATAGIGLASLAAGRGIDALTFADSPSDSNPVLSVPTRAVTLPPIDPRLNRVVITAIAVDPRRQWLAAAGDDHVIRILSLESLVVERTLGDGAAEPAATAVSFNGSDAVGSGRFEQGPPSESIARSGARGHQDLIRTLAFDRQGTRLLSAGNDGRLIIWDRRRGFEMKQEIGSAPAIASARFSPSGNQIAAVGFDPEVFLIQTTAATREPVRLTCRDIRCCRYRNDGGLLAVGARDGHVHLLDPKSGKTIAAGSLHQGAVRDLAFMPGSEDLISVGEDGNLVRLQSGTNTITSQLKITSGRLFALAVLDGDLIAAAGSDDEIYLVKLVPSGALQLAGRLQGHVGSLASLDSLGGTLFSGGFDATVRQWNVGEGLSEQSSGTPENKIARGGEAISESPEASPR